MSVESEAAKGFREGLIAMRDKLAADMDLAEPSVVAQVAGRLQAVLKELDGLSGEVKGSDVDEIAKRRQNRLATADGVSSSGRRRNVRRA